MLLVRVFEEPFWSSRRSLDEHLHVFIGRQREAHIDFEFVLAPAS